MKIKSLYIKDFGIYREQQLRDIAPGLVIIGGLNRAGKTTLLNIFQYLGYGFPVDRTLPSAIRKYDVEAELDLKTGERYNLHLHGHGKPDITLIGNGDKKDEGEDPYILDQFTYQRLFTISLDELKQRPADVKDKEKLQSILLGAGLAEIVQIPGLENEFNNRAYTIGRKHGNPRYGSFTPYYNQIVEGIELRNEALDQVLEYNERKKELSEIEERILRLTEQEIPYLEGKEIIYDLLKNNYQLCQRKAEIKLQLTDNRSQQLLADYPHELLVKAQTLKKEYEEAAEEHEKKASHFRLQVKSGETERLQVELIEHQEELETYFSRLSGLRVRVDHCLKAKSKLMEEKKLLRLETENLNKFWQDLDRLRELKTDRLKTDELDELIVKYNNLKNRYKELEREIKELSYRDMSLTEQLEELQHSSHKSKNNVMLIIIISLALVGIVLSFINPSAGLIAGGASFITGIIYFWSGRTEEKSRLSLEEKIKMQAIEIKSQLTGLEKQKDGVRKLLTASEKKLNMYRKKLGLDEKITPERIRICFQEVRLLKDKLRRWEITKEEIEESTVELGVDLKNIYDLITRLKIKGDDKLIKDSCVKFTKLITDSDILFLEIEKLKTLLEMALDLDEAERRLALIENEMKKLLGSNAERRDLVIKLDHFITEGERYEKLCSLRRESNLLEIQLEQILAPDRVKEALEQVSKDISLKGKTRKVSSSEIFQEIFQAHTSRDDVTRAHRNSLEKLKNLKEELEKLKNQRQSLQDFLEELAATEKLEIAQRQIDNARAGLRPLAKRYAHNKAAAFILAEVRRRFMKRTRDNLLDGSSKILREITGGEYKKILPPEDLTETDFQTILADGSRQKTSRVLSRATREMLFLAIRVSRLQEIKPALPVIIDDSLVNFDLPHLKQTLGIIANLARTHQVFLLTCHSHLIESLTEVLEDVQYWLLQKGIFSKTDKERLVAFLRGVYQEGGCQES